MGLLLLLLALPAFASLNHADLRSRLSAIDEEVLLVQDEERFLEPRVKPCSDATRVVGDRRLFLECPAVLAAFAVMTGKLRELGDEIGALDMPIITLTTDSAVRTGSFYPQGAPLWKDRTEDKYRAQVAFNRVHAEFLGIGQALARAREALDARSRHVAWAQAALAILAAAGLVTLRARRRRTSAPRDRLGPRSAALAGTDTRGRVLKGNYRIDLELGRGGMGVVYEAFDLGLKRTVAMKRMSVEAEAESLGLELFLKEAQTVAALKHPGIVQIYEIFEEGGRIYLVFEYIKGKNLQQVITSQGAVMFKWAKKVLAQVCAALDYAHAKRVIHRDLKPSNIMIGADGFVKVMDFGIARMMTGTSITKTQGWGTPPYMAPEQELGVVSRESDFYAVGVCLYEMLTGRLPFVGPDFLGQKQGAQFERGGLPAQALAVIERALAADPRARFHSGAEFSAALEAS